MYARGINPTAYLTGMPLHLPSNTGENFLWGVQVVVPPASLDRPCPLCTGLKIEVAKKYTIHYTVGCPTEGRLWSLVCLSSNLHTDTQGGEGERCRKLPVIVGAFHSVQEATGCDFLSCGIKKNFRPVEDVSFPFPSLSKLS